MNSRWYLSAFVIILTFLGVFYGQQISVPNQEIVLQFTDVEVTTEEAQNTLEIVKKQLKDLGAENIQVKKEGSGTLKIIYFSDSDVAIIKDTLSKEKKLALDYLSNDQNEENGKFPSDENNTSYNLDVHEIQKAQDADWDLNGTFVSELKPKSNRLFNPNISVYISNSGVDSKGGILKVSFIVNRTIAIAIDNSSHTIPEVRAGPTC